MKCPECVQAGKTSKVFGRGSTATLLGWRPFHDEDGKYHSHDPNIVTNGFECSRGHLFVERFKPCCPNCDYGGPE